MSKIYIFICQNSFCGGVVHSTTCDHPPCPKCEGATSEERGEYDGT
jgi:hypothetical protein